MNTQFGRTSITGTSTVLSGNLVAQIAEQALGLLVTTPVGPKNSADV